MKKLSILLSLLCAGLLVAGCGGGEKKADSTPEAEAVTSIERFWQLNDTNPETAADQRLHCKYSILKAVEGGTKISEAEVKGGGQCDWNYLKTQAGDPVHEVPGGNAAALPQVIAGIDFPDEGANPKWDCATLTVTTTNRTFTTFDCNLKDRKGARESKGFAVPLDGTASKSVEEAAFRLNALF